jgi:RimJ/RimL family protein N-acetyltransferase
MTRCQSNLNFPASGLAWTAPNPLRCELATARVVVRPYRLDDAEAVFRVINDSREHLLPWMPWARGHRQPAETAKYVAEQIIALTAGPAFNAIGLGVFDKATGDFLGGTGVHDVRPDTASCETGYWVRPDRCGRGLATEACALAISWALTDQSLGGLGLRRVRVYCSSANLPSRRIPEKLGLTAEVHQREDYYVEGLGPTDRLGWGVMTREWDTRAHRAIAAGSVTAEPTAE